MSGKIIEESLAINNVGLDGYIRVVSNDGYSYRMPVQTFVELCASAETIQEAVDAWLEEHPEAVTTVQDGSITEVKLSADLQETLHTLIAAVGGPNAAATVADMTDQSKVYVYTGSESGYTAGNWYYFSDGVWVSGGVYNSTALETDTTLSEAGMAADAKATGDQVAQLKEDLTAEETARESADDAINAELATKADADGTIASAEQLLSEKYTVDQVPYTFRASGGDGADREYDEIVGGSIVWNQLCNGSSVTVLNGHKYYMLKGGTASIGASTGSAITGLTSGTDMVSDLTQMFGTTIADYIYNLEQTTAGAGVAWFKKLFPKNYYAYDAGTMMHVSDLQSHDMVGFNAWDEEWEVGAYASSTGGKVDSANRIRCKNAIPVLPNTVYRITGGVGASAPNTMYFYDENQTYLGVSYQLTRYNDIFRTPEKARYMRFNTGTDYGETYKNDICINLHWDGERDGEYESYVKHSYPLDDSLTLRGIPKLDANNQLYYDGDIYAADGTVTRKYGIVDLGTLNWTKHESIENVFNVTVTGLDFKWKEIPSGGIASAMCSKYVLTTTALGGVDAIDKSIALGTGGSRTIYAHDSAYTDAASFKAAMSGVMLVYELATPTTEEAEPYNEIQIVDDFGTEEYVTTSIVPVGHNTKYPANLRSAIERVMEQVPEAPSANGTYTLKATVTANGVTYAWTAE